MTMNFVDSLYFSIQSLLTTGFGDLSPETTAGRIVVIFYCSFGIVTFAVLLAFVRATVLESMNKTWRENEGRILSRLLGGRWIWGRTEAKGSGGENEKAATGKEGRRRSVTDKDGRELTFETTLQGGRSLNGKSGTQREVGGYELAITELRTERAREFRSQVSFPLFFLLRRMGLMMVCE